MKMELLIYFFETQSHEMFSVQETCCMSRKCSNTGSRTGLIKMLLLFEDNDNRNNHDEYGDIFWVSVSSYTFFNLAGNSLLQQHVVPWQ